jgi:hypothetical protein
MTKFEQMLLDKGYIKYFLNHRTMKFEIANQHSISSMMNLDYRYFHKNDENVMKKIASGKSLMDADFTCDDRKGEICFGLYEAGKPPTLINPRPRIEVKRIKDGKEVIENEQFDDSMNIVLQDIPHEKIFKAMYEKSIVIKIDLT